MQIRYLGLKELIEQRHEEPQYPAFGSAMTVVDRVRLVLHGATVTQIAMEAARRNLPTGLTLYNPWI